MQKLGLPSEPQGYLLWELLYQDAFKKKLVGCFFQDMCQLVSWSEMRMFTSNISTAETSDLGSFYSFFFSED